MMLSNLNMHKEKIEGDEKKKNFMHLIVNHIIVLYKKQAAFLWVQLLSNIKKS